MILFDGHKHLPDKPVASKKLSVNYVLYQTKKCFDKRKKTEKKGKARNLSQERYE